MKVNAADVAKVNPSIPFWGGPTGIDTDGTAAGDRVYTYGNSSLRAGIAALSPHTGISLGDDAADGGWSHPLYTVTPGVPGDSGSAFVSADGKAIGVLSTLGSPRCRCRTTSATSARSSPSPSSTPASPACSWSTARRRSRPSSDASSTGRGPGRGVPVGCRA